MVNVFLYPAQGNPNDVQLLITPAVADLALVGTLETLASDGSVSIAAVGDLAQDAGNLSAAGVASIAGDVSDSEASETDVAAGTVSVHGAASNVEASETDAATATVAVQGAATPTQAAQILTAEGTLGAAGIIGDASITEAPETQIAGGGVAIQSAASIAEASETDVAAGTVSVQGAASNVEASEIESASGVAAIQGTAPLTEASETDVAAGTIPLTGVVAVIEASDVSSSAGKVAVHGSATENQESDDLVGTLSASFGLHADVDLHQDDVVLASSGSVEIQGKSSAETTDDESATGSSEIVGRLSIEQDSNSIEVIGSVAVGATVDLKSEDESAGATAVREEIQEKLTLPNVMMFYRSLAPQHLAALKVSDLNPHPWRRERLYFAVHKNRIVRTNHPPAAMPFYGLAPIWDAKRLLEFLVAEHEAVRTGTWNGESNVCYR